MRLARLAGCEHHKPQHCCKRRTYNSRWRQTVLEKCSQPTPAVCSAKCMASWVAAPAEGGTAPRTPAPHGQGRPAAMAPCLARHTWGSGSGAWSRGPQPRAAAQIKGQGSSVTTSQEQENVRWRRRHAMHTTGRVAPGVIRPMPRRRALDGTHSPRRRPSPLPPSTARRSSPYRPATAAGWRRPCAAAPPRQPQVWPPRRRWWPGRGAGTCAQPGRRARCGRAQAGPAAPQAAAALRLPLQPLTHAAS